MSTIAENCMLKVFLVLQLLTKILFGQIKFGQNQTHISEICSIFVYLIQIYTQVHTLVPNLNLAELPIILFANLSQRIFLILIIHFLLLFLFSSGVHIIRSLFKLCWMGLCHEFNKNQ